MVSVVWKACISDDKSKFVGLAGRFILPVICRLACNSSLRRLIGSSRQNLYGS